MFRTNFLNIPFAQNNLSLVVFDDFLTRVKDVERIIEVGTGCGIFSMFLGIYCFYNDKKMITYDIKSNIQEKTKKMFKVLGVDYRIKNIFENVLEIENDIKSQGRTVVLCDNGDKTREFLLFSKFLKTGDFILAHDYARDLEFFNSNIKDKYWNWFEISDKKIQDVCFEHNLESFMQDEFEKCAWVCKQKTSY